MPPPADDNLTWIVPARRAVVKQRTTYWQLLHKWGESLYYYARTMRGWYTIQPAQYNAGLGRLTAYLRQLDPSQPVDFDRTAEGSQTGTVPGNTIDVHPFLVRLWKGPLRVLLEENPSATSVDERVAEVSVRTHTVTYGRERLVLSLTQDERTVQNSGALFLMGDVVEFPLAKFLVECGKNDYADITFDPQGSFFLGTALKENGQARAVNAQPFIHENMIAMRFQLICGMMRGALYSLQDVYQPGTYRSLSVPAPDRTSTCVRARGIAYGATLGNPTSNLSSGYWRIFTGNWGRGSGGGLPPNIPTPRSIRTLAGPGRVFIAPGISCSPNTLTLCSFMLNLDAWGADSVKTEMTRVPPNPRAAAGTRARRGHDPADSIYYGKVETDAVPQSELLGSNDQDQATARDELADAIDEILADLGRRYQTARRGRSDDQPQALNWSFVQDSALGGLGRREKDRLQRLRNNGDVAGLMGQANEQIPAAESAGDSGALDVLRRVHTGTFDKMASVRTRITNLQTGDNLARWQRAALDPPSITIPESWPSASHSGPANCAAEHGITSSDVTALRSALLAKRRELGQQMAVRDAIELLHDISTFSLGAHEVAIVKVYPLHDLMRDQRRTIPLSGHIGAYNPLSGQEEYPAGCTTPARLFWFEASGHLSFYLRPGSGDRVQACGIQPFRWGDMDNRFQFIRESGQSFRFGPAGELRSLHSMRRMLDDALQQAYPRNEVDDGPADPQYKPFVIFKVGPDGPLGNHQELYAERALPFPTYKFAADNGNYPQSSEMAAHQQTALREVREALAAGVEERWRAMHEAFRDQMQA